MCFPALSGPSLERSSVLELPADLMGRISLVLVSQRGLGMVRAVIIALITPHWKVLRS